jgi:transposase InsO family protein
LFHILELKVVGARARIGRDRFFEVLEEKGLPLERLAGVPETTDSRRSLPVFHNPVKGMALACPNQARAAGIAYIRADEGFLYLSLLMDLWSRKIVGWHAGDTLETEGAVRALGMLKSRGPAGLGQARPGSRIVMKPSAPNGWTGC